MSDNIEKKIPTHIAIIMDGNRRWAKKNNLETIKGHEAGANTLEKIATHAKKIGVKYLTVYAFSTENWNRTKEEVGALMLLLKKYVEKMLKKTDAENIKINILGDLSRLDESLQKSINKIIDGTKDNTGLVLNVAFNYGGRNEITNSVKKIAKDIEDKKIKIEDIDEKLFSNYLYTKNQPDPDILIRPGGELRISNFLLWQLAYTEFVFIDKYWPEFSEEDLDNAIKEFQNRHRKFGAN